MGFDEAGQRSRQSRLQHSLGDLDADIAGEEDGALADPGPMGAGAVAGLVDPGPIGALGFHSVIC